MIIQTPWIERKFTFGFPAGLYPVIVERIRGAAPRIADAALGLSQTELTTQLDGKWSIIEQIGHLYDLDELHDGRIDDFLAGKAVLRAADMKNPKTAEANHNAQPYETVLRKFRESRQLFVERLEKLEEKQILLVAMHPRLNQPMRLIDVAYFVAEHDDHHITKIRYNINRLQTG